IPNIHEFYQIHKFAMYLKFVHQDYMKYGIEEDEHIILQNCQNSTYILEAKA
ncbi:9087_t:CDS:1, partial [Cetraspora pellucida]